ncbi:Bax inhibitor-1/YccA family protein [Intestinibacter sp.]
MNRSAYITVENPMSAVFRYLSISIMFMFVGFLFGKLFVPASMVYVANIFIGVLVVALLIFSLMSRKNVIPRSFSMNFVYLFTFVDGILMYPILTYYLYDLGTTLFINIVLGTCAIFAVLAFISYRKPAGHYIGLGSALLTGLVVLIGVSIVNIFIQGTVFNIAVSALGIVIFSAYILYDISLLKYDIECGGVTCKNDLSIHVLNLYLDFVNILLDLLRIISDLTD